MYAIEANAKAQVPRLPFYLFSFIHARFSLFYLDGTYALDSWLLRKIDSNRTLLNKFSRSRVSRTLVRHEYVSTYPRILRELDVKCVFKRNPAYEIRSLFDRSVDLKFKSSDVYKLIRKCSWRLYAGGSAFVIASKNDSFWSTRRH